MRRKPIGTYRVDCRYVKFIALFAIEVYAVSLSFSS